MLVTPVDRRPLTRSVTVVSVSGALAQSFINSSDVECNKRFHHHYHGVRERGTKQEQPVTLVRSRAFDKCSCVQQNKNNQCESFKPPIAQKAMRIPNKPKNMNGNPSNHISPRGQCESQLSPAHESCADQAHACVDALATLR